MLYFKLEEYEMKKDQRLRITFNTKSKCRIFCGECGYSELKIIPLDLKSNSARALLQKEHNQGRRCQARVVIRKIND